MKAIKRKELKKALIEFYDQEQGEVLLEKIWSLIKAYRDEIRQEQIKKAQEKFLQKRRLERQTKKEAKNNEQSN